MPHSSWLIKSTRVLKENSPAILSGAAIAGVIGTVILAIKAAPEAVKRVEELKEDERVEHNREEVTPKEILAVTWKAYLPTVISGVATIVCIVGSNAIGARRSAAAFAAYTLVDSTFTEYKEKVLEQITPAKARKIEDEIQRDRVADKPPSSTQVFITGTGEQLCYDSLTGRYFKSDIEKIRQSVNVINDLVLREMYASQDEFYEMLGLKSTKIGAEMGWTVGHLLEVEFSSHLTEDGQPCLAITYKKLPKLDYQKF
jgi:hypothetical protein